MQIKNPGFKLVVLDHLIQLNLIPEGLSLILKKQKEGYYDKYFQELENIWSNESAGDESEDDPDEAYENWCGIHPEMEKEIFETEIREEDILKIEKLWIVAGFLSGILAPHCSGEEEWFAVDDISDILLLKNIKKIEFGSALVAKDLSCLLKLEKLQEIKSGVGMETIDYFKDDMQTYNSLKLKGCI
jgi:hypothetical protein